MCQTHAVIRFRMLYDYECGWLHWDIRIILQL